MKCMNCGYDNDEDAKFCINCGTALSVRQNLLKEIMLRLLGDSLFIILCILYSAGIVFSLVSRSIPIIRILMAIFLWILYAQREKGVIDSRYMRCISGTVFASYVVRWIWGCMLILSGIVLIVVSIIMEEAANEWGIILSFIEPYIDVYLGHWGDLAGAYLALFSIIIIIVAAIGLAINVSGMRSIHRFAQSVYKSIEDGQVNIVKCGAAQTWLMTFGVLNAISAVLGSSKGFSLFAGGCLSAVYIIAGILVKKYFSGFLNR